MLLLVSQVAAALPQLTASVSAATSAAATAACATDDVSDGLKARLLRSNTGRLVCT